LIFAFCAKRRNARNFKNLCNALPNNVVYVIEGLLRKGGEKMKKLLSCVIAAVMMLVCCTNAFAAAQTRAVGGQRKESSLEISGNTAVYISNYEDSSKQTQRVVITQTLEKHCYFWTWETIGSARTKTVSGSSASLSARVSGLKSGTYRAKTVFKVTDKSGKTQEITVYSAEKKVA